MLRRVLASIFGSLCALYLWSPVPAFAGAVEGEVVFKENCGRCHSLRPGVSAKGPSLSGVIGRKAGSLPGYDYSESLRSADFVWTSAKLDEWLSSPHKAVHGTQMSFLGLSDARARADLIDYLKSLAPNP
jgi:cytochrome c